MSRRLKAIISRTSRRELAIVSAGFGALTLALTYPQILQLSTHTGTHYDALFSIWRLAWIAHQLPRDPSHLFDGNIFYPATNTLAYSDALILQGVIGAPFIWIGVNPVVVHNVLVLLSFVTSGVAMYVLVRSFQLSKPAAWLAGIIFAFQPYRLAHFPQLELLWTCWIPLAFWAFHDVVQTRQLRSGLLLGLFVALQAFSCLYYAVFLVTGLAIVAPILVWRARVHDLRAMLGALAAGAALAAALCLPYVIPYARSLDTIGMRTDQDVRDWSPSLENYLGNNGRSLFYPRLPPRIGPFEGVLFPGVTCVVLASVAIVARREQRVIAYAAMLVVAFDLSLGVNGLMYSTVREILWPYRGLRVPARIFVMVSTALSVLAAFGLERLSTSGPSLQRVSTNLRRHRALAAVLLTLVVLESVAIPLPLKPVPHGSSRLYAWLARRPPSIVMEWPMPDPSNLGMTREPEYMFYSTIHWHQLVNGYSGHYPPSYLTFVELLKANGLIRSIPMIRRTGVRYLILHSGDDEKAYEALRGQLSFVADARLQFSEDMESEEVSIYELTPIQSAPAPLN